MTELLFRFLAGGLVVVMVTVIAEYGSPTIAGILMMFPAITLVSLLFLSQNSSIGGVAFGGIIGLISTASFLITVYLLADKGMFCILAGIVAWLIVAVITYIILGVNG